VVILASNSAQEAAGIEVMERHGEDVTEIRSSLPVSCGQNV
jgi:hypothetical protein